MKLNIFKRKQETDNIAPELQQYYDAEKKERAGLSWLLAVVSVAFVSLVLIGLFFGGKWFYNRLTSDDNTTETVQVDVGETDQAPAETAEPAKPSEQEQTANQPAASNPAPATSQPTASNTPAQVPVTGDSSLPSTGPAENLLAIFISSVLVFGLVHNLVLRTREEVR